MAPNLQRRFVEPTFARCRSVAIGWYYFIFSDGQLYRRLRRFGSYFKSQGAMSMPRSPVHLGQT
jgi:hypothetical protein